MVAMSNSKFLELGTWDELWHGIERGERRAFMYRILMLLVCPVGSLLVLCDMTIVIL